jgi:hypothetical protein
MLVLPAPPDPTIIRKRLMSSAARACPSSSDGVMGLIAVVFTVLIFLFSVFWYLICADHLC